MTSGVLLKWNSFSTTQVADVFELVLFVKLNNIQTHQMNVTEYLPSNVLYSWYCMLTSTAHTAD